MESWVIAGIGAGFLALGGVVTALAKVVHAELTECKSDRKNLHDKVNSLSTDLTNVWKAMAQEVNKPVEVLKNGNH